jgi:aspartyl-tRNA(Asn)/glutamyl-tRNA(Gln) amidotransferase subunit C
MSNFDKSSLENLEKLCRIKCTEDENVEILKDLKKILDYIEELEEVDTEGVKPCNSVLGKIAQNVFREDEIGQTLSREEFLENAPDKIGGMIRVPAIFKSE